MKQIAERHKAHLAFEQ